MGQNDYLITSKDGKTITSCKKDYNGTVMIPSYVKKIEYGAFFGCKDIQKITVEAGNPNYCEKDGALFNKDFTRLILVPRESTHFIIPNGVKVIGEGAFENCSNLTSIVIPDSVTEIGKNVFHDCTFLTSIVIPNSVTKIGYGAFLGCTGIKKITVDENNPNFSVDDGIFYSTMGKKLIVFLNENDHVSIPSYIIKIGEGAFEDRTNLKSIVIPKGVTEIRERAFSGCTNLTSIKIPDGVAAIGNSAFACCKNLATIEIPSSVTKIGEDAFRDCSSITSIVIPNSVTVIETGTFSGCTSLTSIKIPDGVTAIGYKAFFGCTNLTSVEIPNTVDVIWDCAFQGCTNLKSVVINEGVNSIAHLAFSDCTSLTSIKIPSSLTNMTNIVFLGCKKLKEIIVDKDNPSYCSFDGALFSKDMGRLIFVPGGKTTFTLPNNDFDTCYHTFDDCTKLKKLIVAQDHPKLCSINGVLYSKDGSELVRFPMGKETIEIPSHVTKINYDAFANCTRLSSIVIPNNVTEIGKSTFQGCSSLKEIHFKHEDPRALRVQNPYNNLDFELSFEGKNTSEITLYIPIGSGEAYRKHEFYSQFKEVIEE